MLTLIVAHDKNMAIGKGNTIPWRSPEDLAFFKRETLGGAVIMGRKTWESLPFKPLSNRLNIIVSSGVIEGQIVCKSPTEAVKVAHDQKYSRVYGIGGASIYEGLLPSADRLLITKVDTEVEDADTFFPKFNPQAWVRSSIRDLQAIGSNCVVHEFLRANP